MNFRPLTGRARKKEEKMSSVKKGLALCSPTEPSCPASFFNLIHQNVVMNSQLCSPWQGALGWDSAQPLLLAPNTGSPPSILHPVSAPSPEATPSSWRQSFQVLLPQVHRQEMKECFPWGHRFESYRQTDLGDGPCCTLKQATHVLSQEFCLAMPWPLGGSLSPPWGKKALREAFPLHTESLPWALSSPRVQIHHEHTSLLTPPSPPFRIMSWGRPSPAIDFQ